MTEEALARLRETLSRPRVPWTVEEARARFGRPSVVVHVLDPVAERVPFETPTACQTAHGRYKGREDRRSYRGGEWLAESVALDTLNRDRWPLLRDLVDCPDCLALLHA